MVEVDFHPATRHYFDTIDATFPGFKHELLESFTDYIASNREVVPDCFGNDAPYTQPYSAFRAGLMHIHIAVPPTTFPSKRPQADRKCPMNAPDQDAALVYVQGELEEDHYCLLAILYPSAHQLANDQRTIPYLARLAQAFKDSH